MTTEPEALRLATHIEDGYYGHCPQAAAELRRLHHQSLADEALLREAQEVLFCVNVIDDLDQYENLAGEKLAPKVGNILRRLLNRLGE